jgi:cardiolipin synthase
MLWASDRKWAMRPSAAHIDGMSTRGKAAGGTVPFIVILIAAIWLASTGVFQRFEAKLSKVGPSATAPTLPGGATGSGHGQATAPPTAGGPTTAGTYTLVQQPTASYSAYYAQIAAAHTTVDVTMYELNDRTAEAAYIAAAKRHVTVRILLSQAFHSGNANQAGCRTLGGTADDCTQYRPFTGMNGVHVKWAPAGVIYHQKTSTFDRAVADVSTGNLTSNYYKTGWDDYIIDRNTTQVAAIEKTFNNDWSGVTTKNGTVPAAGLVWSPGAAAAMIAQISSAKHTVDFTSEEIAYAPVYNALAADARRNVRCRVVMTASASWEKAFGVLTDAGCTVHVFPATSTALYVHIKQIEVDAGLTDESVEVGSQNASTFSLTRNRELGLILTDRAVIAGMESTFMKNFAAAAAWSK